MNHFFELLLLPLTLPLSWVYGAIVIIRNRLYDLGIFRSVQFDIPVVCVGNITVGGTGKTPHVEYLLNILVNEEEVIAVLSRGYMRKTSGFRYVQATDTVEAVGDEPLQIKRKFPQAIVAVDANRERGIRQLQKDYPHLKVVLLDDAFQHRQVNPSLSILLVDYNRPVWKDHLLPRGRLRDTRSQLKRADTIIVTKCPEKLSEEEKDTIEQWLNIQGFQQIYFSTFAYGDPVPMFTSLSGSVLDGTAKVLAVTGIARPKPFVDRLRSQYTSVQTLSFPDHHNFTDRDLRKMEHRATQADYLITTEKDSVRILQYRDTLTARTKEKMYYLPVIVKVLGNEIGFREDIAEILKGYESGDIPNRSTLS